MTPPQPAAAKACRPAAKSAVLCCACTCADESNTSKDDMSARPPGRPTVRRFPGRDP